MSELQFNFNKDIDVKLESATICINKGEPRKAQLLIDEGGELVTKSNELVKLTDVSEFGWKSVQQYVENDLGYSDDDCGI